MAINITQKDITLEAARTIVDANKPFDTGYLFTFGNRYNDTTEYIHIIYDLNVVPYIQFLEEGTVFSTKHVGFISADTVGQINAYVAGMDLNDAQKFNNQRASLISQGVMEHAQGFGLAGGRYDKFIGIT